MKLISMVDYVMGKHQPKVYIPKEKQLKSILRYAEFLSMPLTLGKFVPTDEDENILEEPEYYELWKSFGSYTQKGESIVVECRKYHEALSNVIFEGCTAEKKLTGLLLK